MPFSAASLVLKETNPYPLLLHVQAVSVLSDLLVTMSHDDFMCSTHRLTKTLNNDREDLFMLLAQAVQTSCEMLHVRIAYAGNFTAVCMQSSTRPYRLPVTDIGCQ